MAKGFCSAARVEAGKQMEERVYAMLTRLVEKFDKPSSSLLVLPVLQANGKPASKTVNPIQLRPDGRVYGVDHDPMLQRANSGHSTQPLSGQQRKSTKMAMFN